MVKTKKSLKILIAILLLGMLIAISACSFGETNGSSYSVSLNLNGGEGIEAKDFISGNMLVQPELSPIKKGCRFLGWFYDSEFQKPITFDIKIKENIIIHAKWSDVSWVVSYVYGGEIATVNEEVADKGNAISPIELPQRNGYAIVGWYKNTNYTTKFSFTESIQDDISIYAKWDIVNYTINYHFDNGQSDINTVYEYTINNAVTLASPSRFRYEFLGWYDNADFLGSPVTTIVKGSYGNKEFFAKYLCEKNDIERTMLGADIGENTITINVSHSCAQLTLDATNLIVSDRATFVVKETDNAIIVDNIIILPEKPSGGFVEKTAIIEVTSEKGEVKTYELTVRRYAEGASVTITFDTGRAPAIGNSIIDVFTAIAQPTLSDVDGYNFDGWYNESSFLTEFSFDELIGFDKTLYARFTPIVYNISYNLGLGSNNTSNPNTYTIEDTINFANATDTDLYNFVGWYADKDFVTEVVTINNQLGDTSIFAKYNLAVDNSAMSLSYSGNQTFTSEQIAELTKYLEYVIYEQTATASFTLTLPDESYDTFIQTAWKNIQLPKSSVGWTASRGGAVVTMTFTYNAYPNTKASQENKYTQLSYIIHEEYTPIRGEHFEDFKINSIDNTAVVASSERLFYVLASGYKPMPTAESSAERIYNKAKVVLRSIIDDSMSDTEKLHRIYDWLILNVTYDKDLFDMSVAGGQTDIHKYNGFYLEGVFDDLRAVCDGISKALVVLARIEGIEAYQVTYAPETVSVGHAWNKVRVGGNYYIIDATSGGTIIGESEVLTHKYFMVTDSNFKTMTAKGVVGADDYFEGYEATHHSDKVAQTAYNIYSDISVNYQEEPFDMIISSQEELNALVAIFKQMDNDNLDIDFTIDVYIAFDYGTSINEEIQIAVNGSSWSNFSHSFDNGYLILIVKRTI